MKNLILLSLLFNFSICFSQSEQLIPQNAITVFSINNLNLLQKISMDDLVKYDFMEEVHQELFDGSTSGKTLKDAGIDFNQRLNVFYGKTDDYEVSGFTFGVNNSSLLFEVFDDFTELKSNYKDVKEYGSFFNNLILKNNSALLIRIEPTAESIDRKTDSIWYSRGNEYPYGGMYEEEILFDEGFDEGDFDFEQAAQTHRQARKVDARVLRVGQHHHVGGKRIGERVHEALEIRRANFLFALDDELHVAGQLAGVREPRFERHKPGNPARHVVRRASCIEPLTARRLFPNGRVRRRVPQFALHRLQVEVAVNENRGLRRPRPEPLCRHARMRPTSVRGQVAFRQIEKAGPRETGTLKVCAHVLGESTHVTVMRWIAGNCRDGEKAFETRDGKFEARIDDGHDTGACSVGHGLPLAKNHCRSSPEMERRIS